MEKNIGLFNESFPPVMDGVAICVENYAKWMQKRVGGVTVVTPENHGVSYDDKDYEVLNDRVPGADPSFCMRNFKVAARMNKEKRAIKTYRKGH